MYGAAYDEKLRAAEKSANARAASTQAMIEALTPLYEQQLASLSQQYHSGREYLSNQALSRGLGRSTYLTDQLAGSVSRQRADENTLLSQMNSAVSGGNDQLLGSIVNWMTGEENAVVIDSKSMSAETLTVPPQATMLLGLLFTIVLPIAAIIIGIVVAILRRRH